MRWEKQIAMILAVFAVSCGRRKQVRRLERPTLETLPSGGESDLEAIGENAAPGLLRPCQTLTSGGGLVEMRCAEHHVVEFRRAQAAGSADVDLDELVKILEARFGPLSEERSDARIDSFPVRLSSFESEKDDGPAGLGAVIGNTQGQYWALACYRKDGEASAEFCGDAIATAARAGGLAHVEARPPRSLGEGKLEVPEGCQSTPGQRISCATGQLSWSAEDGRDLEQLRDKTLAGLRAQAEEEGVSLRQLDEACQLLDEPARCTLVELSNPEKGEYLSFVLATGGGQKRLVVCSFPAPLSASLPVPCGQAITRSSP